MFLQIENFLGINNVDVVRRVPKVQFSQDGQSISLSGDASTMENYRPKKDGSLEVRNGRTKKTGANITNGVAFWVSPLGDIALVQDGSTLKLLNADYSLTTLGSVGTSFPCSFAEHLGKERFIFVGNRGAMKKYCPERSSNKFVDWYEASDWQRTETPFEPMTSFPEDTMSGILGVTGAMYSAETFEGLSLEQEYPRRQYNGPKNTDIILSYFGCMYLAYGRFLLESEPTNPEIFRSTNNIPQYEEITAISAEPGFFYVHTRNFTKVYRGNHSSDWAESGEIIFPYGAIKQNIIHPFEYPVPSPVFLSPRGWATASQGVVSLLDDDNFRLDLSTTAQARLTYDIIEREISCEIKQ